MLTVTRLFCTNEARAADNWKIYKIENNTKFKSMPIDIILLIPIVVNTNRYRSNSYKIIIN